MDVKFSARVTLEVPGSLALHEASLQAIQRKALRVGVDIDWQAYPDSVFVTFGPTPRSPDELARLADLAQYLIDEVQGHGNWLGQDGGLTRYHALVATRHLRRIGLEQPPAF